MDWNGDGLLDVLSGCYWSDGADAAHINLLAGKEDGQFAAAEPLLTAAGNPLVNVVTAAEETSSETEDDGEEPEAPGDDVEWNNICTHQHAVDYDGDGDLDLVTGNIGNTFFFVENRGSNEHPELSESPQRLTVNSPGAHSSPHLVDWDGDGDLDLLSGSSQGGAYLSENTGSRTTPKWAPFKTLIPGSDAHTQSEREGPIVPAPSTRLWVVDWNHDGLLDVLTGDSVTIANRKEGLSQSEYETLEADFEQRLQAASDAYSKIAQAYYAADADGDMTDELSEQYQQAQSDYSEVHRSKSEFVDERRTGHVWLYLQQQN